LATKDESAATASLAHAEKPGRIDVPAGTSSIAAAGEHGSGAAVPRDASGAHATSADAAAVTGKAGGVAPETGVAAKAGERVGQHFGVIEPRWSERVADAVRLSALRGGGDIRLQLEPEGLGHIDVRLQLHQDGVRAVIVAEHESTRQLLANQQHLLQDAFARSDLRLSDFSVDVGSGGNAAAFTRGGDDDGRQSPPPTASVDLLPTPDAIAAAPGDATGRVNVRV
jgi:flagellar hook-length control protein FliK